MDVSDWLFEKGLIGRLYFNANFEVFSLTGDNKTNIHRHNQCDQKKIAKSL